MPVSLCLGCLLEILTPGCYRKFVNLHTPLEMYGAHLLTSSPALEVINLLKFANPKMKNDNLFCFN